MKNKILVLAVFLLTATLIIWNYYYVNRELLIIDGDISVNIPETKLSNLKQLILLSKHRDLQPLDIDYPEMGSIFPPDLVPPTIIWHDNNKDSKEWILRFSFQRNSEDIYVLAKPLPLKLPTFPKEDLYQFKPTRYQLSAKQWRPSDEIWDLIKKKSKNKKVILNIYGADLLNKKLISQNNNKFSISSDKVDAFLFYREVALDSSDENKGLKNVKLKRRNLKHENPSILMENILTCVNCHSFSLDGKYFGMDVDGPRNDKGTYVFAKTEQVTELTKDDVITWNSYHKELGKGSTIGFLSKISPTGKYVISTVGEKIFFVLYKNQKFLQAFFPIQGILAYFDAKTKEIKALPGADTELYVHTGGDWSPDEKYITFSRARSIPVDTSIMDITRTLVTVKSNADYKKFEPQYIGDPLEVQIKYDLYRIPFNNGEGGKAVPVEGASKNGMSNSFPKYSPDSKWIVYVQARNGLLMRPDSKLFIIPAEGGKARPLTSNKGPMNSWHSWSPNSRWLVFASKRNTPYTQLFLTHINEEGNSSPGILIPNSTPANRAANIPEFVNIKYDDLQKIVHPYSHASNYNERGRNLFKQGKLDEAIGYFKKAIKAYPDFSRAHNNLGAVMLTQGKLKEAAEYFRKTLRLNPNFVPAHNNLGMILSKQGKFRAAIVYYKKALRLDPENEVTHYNLGTIMFKQGKLKEAAEHFREALRLNPNLAAAHKSLAVLLEKLGRPQEAGFHYTEAIRLDPKVKEPLR